MPEAETLLKVEKLSRHFGGVRAVDEVTYSVSPGVIKAIIGPNGAGKTTMFNLIAGSLKPTAGDIFLKEKKVTGKTDYKMATLGVARTFQSTRIFHNMTVIENVMIGRHPRSRSGFASSALRMPWMIKEEKKISTKALQSLEFVGLANKAHEAADNLPFKDQRLLEFARALATEPEILLADEPAAGLNTRETREIAALIKKINASGVTVLLVEHDMSLVMQISDEIIVLDYGKKIAEGNPEEIRNNKDVIAVYLGRRGENA